MCCIPFANICCCLNSSGFKLIKNIYLFYTRVGCIPQNMKIKAISLITVIDKLINITYNILPNINQMCNIGQTTVSAVG